MLYLVNGEHYSGAERVQDLLASRLPEFGFEVEFACVKRGKFAKMREAQGTVLHEVPMRSRLDVTIIKRLLQLVRPTVVSCTHTRRARPCWVGSCRAFQPCRWSTMSTVRRPGIRAVGGGIDAMDLLRDGAYEARSV